MGTSKSFSDVKHSMVPNWGTLSSSLTNSCNGTTLSSDKKQTILRNFVSSLGGANLGGRGGSHAGGRSSIKSAKKIGGLFANFINSGNNIRETLTSIGITDIDNKSVNDIINHLIEYCSSDSSTIDDNAAKEATRLLLEELIGEADTIDDIDTLLSQKFESSSLEDVIIGYFGNYINEILSRWFYENLIKNKNENDCNNLFSQIRSFIREKVTQMHKNNPLQNIDWASEHADTFIKNIQQDVLTVFE